MLPPTPRRIALALAALCLAAAPPPPAAARPPEPRGVAAAPDATGPWDVGRTTFTAVDPARNGRSLAVDAWYPVDPRDAGGPRSAYDLLFAELESPLAGDAPPPSARGPFPLVVFSHGNGGIRFQSFFLTEALASHGFVVVAPDHTGNTAIDLLTGTSVSFLQAAMDRPRDVSFLITHMLARSGDPSDLFAGRVDPERIGVTGHSFGGFTALAAATGFGDFPPDPRVRAIVPIAPASTPFSDEALAGIRIPTLILGGTADVTTPLDPQSTRPFALISSRPRYRVDVIDGGHNSFTSICDIAGALIDAGIPPALLDLVLGTVDEGCAPELIPIDEAHRLTNHYAVSFLRRYVMGDRRYRRVLTPGRSRSEPDARFFQVAGGGEAR